MEQGSGATPSASIHAGASAELSSAIVARFDRASLLRSTGFNAVARNLYTRRRLTRAGQRFS
jgi:hypothetical protein